jgi:hypothetical protein
VIGELRASDSSKADGRVPRKILCAPSDERTSRPDLSTAQYRLLNLTHIVTYGINSATNSLEGLMESIIRENLQRHRRRFVGGSDARIIMGKDEAALLRLWREKRGEAEPEDLSVNLIVQLGVVTEDLNRRWYEANTGQVITDIQRRIRHPILRWMGATLDGRVQGSEAMFEAKFMLPWSFSEEAAVANICRSCSTTCGWWRRDQPSSR